MVLTGVTMRLRLQVQVLLRALPHPRRELQRDLVVTYLILGFFAGAVIGIPVGRWAIRRWG